MSFSSSSQTSSTSLKPLKTLAMVLCGLAIVFSGTAFAQTGLPLVNVSSDPNGATEYSLTLQVLILMTVLTLLPSILIMMTSFVRIIIVMSLLRQAIGTAQTPPNTVLVGIALFLTFFIMAPVFETLYEDAFVPYVAEEISAEAALDAAIIPVRSFMLTQTREADLMVFSDIADFNYTDESEIPLSILIPSFMTSELKTAFTIGFLIYIPFVIIDLVVASVLMSMGMMMLSPMMISMPFKLMLFVLADGWILIMQSLTASFSI
jgi:flagellar biosynthetic protein FliP